ncbi:calmodulin-dependent protein kinase, partial [Fusobacterium animalis ATCC 51191]
KNYESKEELLGDINEFRELLVNKKFSDLLPENLRLLKNIYDKIYEDMKGKDKVVPIYKFIDSAINNYGEDKALSGYINYTLYLNGLKN